MEKKWKIICVTESFCSTEINTVDQPHSTSIKKQCSFQSPGADTCLASLLPGWLLHPILSISLRMGFNCPSRFSICSLSSPRPSSETADKHYNLRARHCSVAQRVRLCDPMDGSTPSFLSFTISQICSNSRPLSQGCSLTISSSVVPSPLPSILPSIRVFSGESVLCIRRPKYWSLSISPFSEYSGLIFFRIHWFDLPAVQFPAVHFLCIGKCKRLGSLKFFWYVPQLSGAIFLCFHILRFLGAQNRG